MLRTCAAILLYLFTYLFDCHPYPYAFTPIVELFYNIIVTVLFIILQHSVYGYA